MKLLDVVLIDRDIRVGIEDQVHTLAVASNFFLVSRAQLGDLQSG